MKEDNKKNEIENKNKGVKAISINRRCTQDNTFDYMDEAVHYCARFENITLDKFLGAGSFGEVYSAVAKVGDKDILLAVKIINSKFTEARFEAIDYEIAYSYVMGAYGIGPRVHDAFYIVDKYNNYKQIIIMDYYEYNCMRALEKVATDKQSANIIRQMILLTKEMIFIHKTYCVDIKPENFVVDGDLNVVKMIDFGNEWCHPSVELDKEGERHLFQVVMFQLYFMTINLNIKLNRHAVISIFRDYVSKDLPDLINEYYGKRRYTMISHYTNGEKKYAKSLAAELCCGEIENNYQIEPIDPDIRYSQVISSRKSNKKRSASSSGRGKKRMRSYN